MENESNKAVAKYFSHLSERVMQCNKLMGSIQLIYQERHPNIDFGPLSNNLQPDINSFFLPLMKYSKFLKTRPLNDWHIKISGLIFTLLAEFLFVKALLDRR